MLRVREEVDITSVGIYSSLHFEQIRLTTRRDRLVEVVQFLLDNVDHSAPQVLGSHRGSICQHPVLSSRTASTTLGGTSISAFDLLCR